MTGRDGVKYYVRNKTIIGLKLKYDHNNYDLIHVRNKTIIGLKYVIEFSSIIHFVWLEIRL